MVVYKEFTPCEALRELIKCFWVLKKEYSDDDPIERVLPDSYVELILSFGEPYYLNAAGDLPESFMIGLLKDPLPLRTRGIVKILCARLFPWGVISLFDFRPIKSINEGYDLGISTLRREALAKLMRDDRFEDAVAKFEEIMLEHFLKANFDKNVVNAAAQVLYRENGECRIEDLVKMCFTTKRTLERNFNSNLGMSPKSYALNVRFDKAKKAIIQNPFIELTELAHRAGYYDQAHFVKDFKAFCGCTPTDFAEGIKRMAAIFNDHENVVFLQGTEDEH